MTDRIARQKKNAPASARAIHSVAATLQARRNKSVLQAKMKAVNFKELLMEQGQLETQLAEKKVAEKYTTVGFEFEFATMSGKNPFKGASHVEIAQSTQQINRLPFNLETDASDALELVTPPFWVETMHQAPIPLAEDIAQIDGMIKARLKVLSGDMSGIVPEHAADEVDKEASAAKAGQITLLSMVKEFQDDPGLTFPLGKVDIKAKNLSARTEQDFSKDDHTVSKADVEGGGIEKIKKWKKGIDTQINMASSAEIFLQIEQLVQKIKPATEEDLRYKDLYGYLMLQALPKLGKPKPAKSKSAKPEPIKPEDDAKPEDAAKSARLDTFSRIWARYLAGIPAAPYSTWLRDIQGKIFNTADKGERQNTKKLLKGEADDRGAKTSGDYRPDETNKATKSFYQTAAKTTSHVKDVHDVWLKDTLMNVGLGILQPGDWEDVFHWMDALLKAGVLAAYKAPASLFQIKLEGLHGEDLGFVKLKQDEQVKVNAMNKLVADSLVAAANQIMTDIQKFNLPKQPDANLFIGPLRQQEFMGHNPRFIGTRQDTYVDAPIVQLPAMWPNTRLHVVELRMENIVGILDALAKGQGKATQTPALQLPPMRLIGSKDWMTLTGFDEALSINELMNEYGGTKDTVLKGKYDVTRDLIFEAAGIKAFTDWLKPLKITPVDWAQELGISLKDLTDFTLPYRKLSGARNELEFYKTQKERFKNYFRLGHHLANARKRDLPTALNLLIQICTEKGIDIRTLEWGMVGAWLDEQKKEEEQKKKEQQEALAKNNPWIKKT